MRNQRISGTGFFLREHVGIPFRKPANNFADVLLSEFISEALTAEYIYTYLSAGYGYLELTVR